MQLLTVFYETVNSFPLNCIFKTIYSLICNFKQDYQTPHSCGKCLEIQQPLNLLRNTVSIEHFTVYLHSVMFIHFMLLFIIFQGVFTVRNGEIVFKKDRKLLSSWIMTRCITYTGEYLYPCSCLISLGAGTSFWPFFPFSNHQRW